MIGWYLIYLCDGGRGVGLSPGPGTTSAIVVTRLRRDIAALGPSVALKGTKFSMHGLRFQQRVCAFCVLPTSNGLESLD